MCICVSVTNHRIMIRCGSSMSVNCMYVFMIVGTGGTCGYPIVTVDVYNRLAKLRRVIRCRFL